MPFDAGRAASRSDTARLLLYAASLIEDPQNWCVGRLRRRRWLKLRIAYCAVGAVQRANEDLFPGQFQPSDVRCAYYSSVRYAKDCLEQVATRRGYPGIAALNDHPTASHAMVLEAFHEAADLADGLPWHDS